MCAVAPGRVATSPLPSRDHAAATLLAYTHGDGLLAGIALEAARTRRPAPTQTVSLGFPTHGPTNPKISPP